MPRAVEYHDLAFAQLPVVQYSSRGFPYRIWVDVGVPKIQEVLQNCAFYLYSTADDAEAGSDYGGTGFFVGVRSPKHHDHIHLYGASNWHVAIRDGHSVIRVNTQDGGVDVLDLDPGAWTKHPDGHDIAITPLSVDLDLHRVGIVLEESFATKQTLQEKDIGVGDDCFMIGRFIDHAGGPTNRPAARFGNLSVMPSPIKQRNGKTLDSYCIDLHSRSGFSGSPVFVYRTPGNHFEHKIFDTSDRFIFFLGIHWGQFPEKWEIAKGSDLDETNLVTEGQYVKGVSGMTCVSPAWHLQELLYMPKFVKQRDQADRDIARRKKKQGLPAENESASAAAAETKGDVVLKKMLETPPNPRK